MSLPPGPSAPAAIQTLEFLASPSTLGGKLLKRYGDVHTIKNSALGTMVILVDPELVKQVFTGDPDVLHAGEANRSLEMLVGDRSVLLLDGAEHLRHRRLLMPPFHGARMSASAAARVPRRDDQGGLAPLPGDTHCRAQAHGADQDP